MPGPPPASRRDLVVFAVAVLVQLVVLYLPRVPGGGVDLPYADLLVHAAVFATVVWTGRRAGLPGFVLAVLLGCHAVLSEVLQATLLTERSGDSLDVLANLLGVAVGLLVPTGLRRRG